MCIAAFDVYRRSCLAQRDGPASERCFDALPYLWVKRLLLKLVPPHGKDLGLSFLAQRLQVAFGGEVVHEDAAGLRGDGEDDGLLRALMDVVGIAVDGVVLDVLHVDIQRLDVCWGPS